MKNLTVTSIVKQSWDCEVVTAENEDYKIVVHLKNQKDHGVCTVGETFSLEPKVKKSVAKKATKKAAPKKPAKKVDTPAAPTA